MGWLGQQLVGIRTRPEDVDLPPAADKARPLAPGLENRIKGISKFQTPNKDFYRVDVNLTVPVIDLDSWRLEIDGDVDNELSYSFDDLLGMDLSSATSRSPACRTRSAARTSAPPAGLGVPLQAAARRGRRGQRGRPDPDHRDRRLHDQHARSTWPSTAATRWSRSA